MKEGEQSPYPARGGAAEQTRKRAHRQARPPQSGEGPATARVSVVGAGKGPAGAEQGSWASGQASGTLGNVNPTPTPTRSQAPALT